MTNGRNRGKKGGLRVTRCLTAVFAWVCLCTQASTVEQNGIRVKFEAVPLSGTVSAQPILISETDAHFRFTLTDGAGNPIAGAYPAAWVQQRAETVPTDTKTCHNMIGTFIGGSVVTQATLNLNVYYVLVMNSDATITVVDPLFNFGRSNILTMIPLSSPAYDWALAETKNRLLAALPESGTVAFVDTVAFELTSEIKVPGVPRRIAVQPDEQYAWVESGAHLTVIDTDSGAIKAEFELPEGSHSLAFSGDSRYAFVAHRASDQISVYDVATLKQERRLASPGAPSSLAYSSGANALFGTHASGAIRGFDANALEPLSESFVDAGLKQIAFAPNGRHAVILNPENNHVYVFDAARNQVTKSGEIASGPDQVSFSETVAYIRHEGTEIIYMIPMDVITDPSVALQVVDFPGGEQSFGTGTTPASNIVQTPGENAVLVAHPTDQQVYYYKEGMAAPMGSFKNANRNARAVLALDRTLRELEPGYYQTVGRLQSAGVYDVAFFLESPRVAHCFSLRVLPNKALEQMRPETAIVQLLPDQTWPLGEASEFRFRLQGKDGQPIAGVDPFEVNAVLVPGTWFHRTIVREVSPGEYRFQWTPRHKGTYIINLNARWKQLNLAAPQQVMFDVD